MSFGAIVEQWTVVRCDPPGLSKYSSRLTRPEFSEQRPGKSNAARQSIRLHVHRWATSMSDSFEEVEFLEESSTGPAGRPTTHRQPPFPTFVMVVAIIDIVFCVFRGFGLLVSLGAHLVAPQQPGQTVIESPTASFEMAAAVAIVAFGLTANTAMLAKVGWAVIPGYLAVAATLADCAMDVWSAFVVAPQVVEQMGQQLNHSQDLAGTMIIATVALTTLWRVAILVVYVFALLKFSRWVSSRVRD
jgi:hypothetical protein